MKGEPLADATSMLRHACLTRCSDADPTVAELMAVVYDELRALAAYFMQAEPIDHTLQPTAIVHEAYLRLIDQSNVTWQGRAHFFAMAAKMIRRVLIDHSRRRNAVKRGGDMERTYAEDSLGFVAAPAVDLLDLDDAMQRLAMLSPVQAQIIEMRFFGGLSEKEVAHVLGVSRKTVAKHWSVARAWLSRALACDEG